MLLGAGRVTKDAAIDLTVGLVLHKKIGDQVEEGEPLATVHMNEASNKTSIEEQVRASLHSHQTSSCKHSSTYLRGDYRID